MNTFLRLNGKKVMFAENVITTNFTKEKSHFRDDV